MIIYWVALGLAVLAGMAVQRVLVDRLWPAPVHAPAHAPDPGPAKTAARRQLEFEDTMDVMGAAHGVGYRSGFVAAQQNQRRADKLEFDRVVERLDAPGELAWPGQLPAGGEPR